MLYALEKIIKKFMYGRCPQVNSSKMGSDEAAQFSVTYTLIIYKFVAAKSNT